MASPFTPRIEAARNPADLAVILRDLRRREARRRRGPELSYRQIAARTGWSAAAVGAYFTGTRTPSAERFETLIAMLDAAPDERSALHRARARVALPLTGPGQRGPGPEHGAAGPPPDPVARALPATVTAFVGRDSEMATLDRFLAADPERGSTLITVVTGMAGVGKSALAVRWANRVASAFPDGQLYVDLQGHDPDVPRSTLDALGVLLSGMVASPVRLPSDVVGRLALYRERLRDRAALVILDNAGSAAQVRTLLPPTPCAVVVTSRERLDDLDPVGAVRRIALGPLPESDATGVLRRLVGARVDREPGAARALARRCGYLPLALRIAAEQVAAHPGLALSHLVAEIDDVAGDLDVFSIPGDPRADVRTLFAWSERRLAGPAARLFRLVSLIPGQSVDRYGLAALAGVTTAEADRLADALRNANLLADGTDGRFVLHDLLRRHAHELCRRDIAAAERSAAVSRLLDHYVTVARIAGERQFPLSRSTRPTGAPEKVHSAVGPALPDVASASAWLAAERSNLVRACLYAADRGWPEHAVALALVLRPVLDGGYDSDARVVHSAALAAAEQLGSDCGDADRAVIRTAFGIANWRLGRHAEALEALRLAFDEHLHAGNGGGAALAMAAVGLVHDAQGRYREAVDCQQRGLDLARRAGVRDQEAVQLINLGFGHLRLEEYEFAAHRYRQAYEIFAGQGERLGQAHARAGLAASLEGLGRYEAALAEAAEAVATYRAFDQTVYRVRTTATVGSIHRRMGQAGDALDRLTEALRECRDGGLPRPTANVLNTLGDVYLDLTDHPRALASHAEALGLADRCGDRWELTRALVGLGDVHAAAGDLSLARGYWRQGLARYAESGLPHAARIEARLSAPGP